MSFISRMFLAFLLWGSVLCNAGYAQSDTRGDAAAEPATLGFGAGYYEVLRHQPDKAAADFRLDYRSAVDLLGLVGGQNAVVALRPFAGLEATSQGGAYGLGGVVADAVFWRHWVVSPSIGAGIYYDGNGKKLGSLVEFRSTFETGYRFDDASRLTLAFSHISNANIAAVNPGTEIIAVYYHIPVARLWGH